MEADMNEKGMSWVLATTPTNRTTIKISRAKHVQWEDRNSLICRLSLWRPFFLTHRLSFPLLVINKISLPLQRTGHMCQYRTKKIPITRLLTGNCESIYVVVTSVIKWFSRMVAMQCTQFLWAPRTPHLQGDTSREWQFDAHGTNWISRYTSRSLPYNLANLYALSEPIHMAGYLTLAQFYLGNLISSTANYMHYIQQIQHRYVRVSSQDSSGPYKIMGAILSCNI